jgi:hypothetical protein
MTSPKEVDRVPATGISYRLLIPGEVYRTTEEFVWADWDNGWKHIKVPKNLRLMFRSWQPYDPEEPGDERELILFFDLENRRNYCLLGTPERPLIRVARENEPESIPTE